MSQERKQIDLDLLLSRILQGKESKDEVEFFTEWIKDYRNEVYFDKYKELWHVTVDESYIEHNKPLDTGKFVTYIRSKRRHEKQARVIRIAFSIAASIILFVGVTYLAGFYDMVFVNNQDFSSLIYSTDSIRIEQNNGKSVKMIKGAEKYLTAVNPNITVDMGDSIKKKTKEKLFNTVLTPSGERVTMLLSDGTKVYLTSNSYLRYPASFDKEKREVTLVGRAYFEVKKSTAPFIVNTADMDVEVLGTSFDVESRNTGENASVILVEGSVKVHADGKTTIIRPDEQMKFSRKDREMSVKNVDSKSLTMWKDGVLVVDGQTFLELIESLSSWYGVQIIDETLIPRSDKFNGKFDREDIEAAIKAICISANTKYKIVDGKLVLED